MSERALLIAAGGGLGDSLLASMCIAALRERYDAVDALTLPGHVDAFNHGSGVSEIFSAMESSSDLIRKFRAKRYAAAVVTWATGRNALLALFSGARRRVGQARRLYSGLFTDRVVVRSERGDTHSHWSEILLDYPRALGCETLLRAPRFELTELERAEAQRLLQLHGVADEFFLVHPTTAVSPRRPVWPLAGWRAVVNRIRARYGLPVFVTGSPADRAIAAELAAQTGATSIAGQTSVGSFAALANRARGVVTMESAPMHLAAAVGAPTVGVFPLRANFPDRWRALGPRVAVVRDGFVCPPGREHVMEACRTYECVARLDVDAIERALDEVLVRPRPSLRIELAGSPVA